MENIHDTEGVQDEETGLATIRRKLLSIFQNEKDNYSHDVLRMDDLFANSILALRNEVDQKVSLGTIVNMTPEFIGMLSSFMKGTQDIKFSHMFAADMDKLSRSVKRGIKKGVFHVAESKMIDGNHMAMVVDDNKKFVAQITLKEVQNSAELWANINSIALQMAIQSISEQLQAVGRDVKYLVEFARREALQTRFLNARNAIEKATYSESAQEIDSLLKSAETYLTEGLNSLYADLEANIDKLVSLHDKRFSKLDDIDACLNYIQEDLNLIPKYIGLRLHVLNAMMDFKSLARMMDVYQHKIHQLVTKPLGASKLTAAQHIHEYFPYTEENRDVFLAQFSRIDAQLQAVRVELLPEDKQVHQILVVEEYEDGKAE